MTSAASPAHGGMSFSTVVRRPVSRERLEQMLRRIPAASVVRIETHPRRICGGGDRWLRPGGERDPQATGGLVRRSHNGRDCSEIHRHGTGLPARNLSASRASGGSRAHLGAKPRLTTRLARARCINVARRASWRASGLATSARFSGACQRTWNTSARLARANSSASANGARERSFERIRIRRRGGRGGDRTRTSSGAAKPGHAFTLEAGGGEFDALALERIGKLRVRAEEEDELFMEATRTSETIARFEHRRASGSLQLFASVEAALNSLISDTSLSENGVEADLVGSDVSVSERRAEASAGAVWKAGGALTVEPALRIEYSQHSIKRRQS